MPTCGYICPACEGRGYNEKGNTCEWCSVEEIKPNNKEDGDKMEEKNTTDKKDNKKDDHKT